MILEINASNKILSFSGIGSDNDIEISIENSAHDLMEVYIDRKQAIEIINHLQAELFKTITE
jgi:hypothetical protein